MVQPFSYQLLELGGGPVELAVPPNALVSPVPPSADARAPRLYGWVDLKVRASASVLHRVYIDML